MLICVAGRYPHYRRSKLGPRYQPTNQREALNEYTGLTMMPVGKPSVGVGCGGWDGPRIRHYQGSDISSSVRSWRNRRLNNPQQTFIT